MLLIFPLIAFVLFYLILKRSGIDWRRAFLAAAVLWGASLAAMTEVLSLSRMIARGWIAVGWLLVCAAGLFWGAILDRRSPRFSSPEDARSKTLDDPTKILLVGAGLVVFLVALTALIAAPSTQDSMEYHLPRVVMWMSNHSVRFFPTPNYCQLIYGPWAEYAMMHSYILSGTDRFVNLIETFSLLGCGIGVSLIAKLLGAGLRGQILAGVISVTIPSGILEASGPQNTYVVAFWIVSTVAFLLCATKDPGWLNLICLALAAGLAIYTKGTAYTLLPFLVLGCWWTASPSTRIRLLKKCALCLVIVLALNSPQYARCYTLSGTPIGLPLSFGEVQFTMGHVDLVGRLANSLRNVSLHFGTPSSSVNSHIERVFRLVMNAMKVNPDDPQATIWGEPYHLNHLSFNEVTAGNPLDLALFLFSIGLVLWHREDRSNRRALWYALSIVLAFALFCALLRWQMWSARYHLPLFVLASAFSGLALERYSSRKVATAVASILIILGLMYASMNRFRALVPIGRFESVWQPRPLLYFADDHDAVAADNIAAANAVNGSNCSNVAIDSYTALPDAEIRHSPKSFFVYPLFALIHADGSNRTVWYSGVHNLTTRYENPQAHPNPCAVVCLDCADVPEKWAEYRKPGGQASVFGNIVVFSGAGAAPNPGMIAPGTK